MLTVVHMSDVNQIMFCPKCEKLLDYKEDYEKVQLWLECKCGHKERADNQKVVVVYKKELPDLQENQVQIPITKEIHCPHCGHEEAGFFEEWMEDKPKVVQSGANSRTSLINNNEEEFVSGSDEEEVIARWKKERLRGRKKIVPDEKNREILARREEKLRAEENAKRQEIQRRMKKLEARRALIFVCLNSSCSKTWEGD